MCSSGEKHCRQVRKRAKLLGLKLGVWVSAHWGAVGLMS